MTILWFSRHAPTSRQLNALKSTFGKALIVIQDHEGFAGADDILTRYARSKANDLVLVAPLSVVQAVVRRGLNPIWAEMDECKPSHPDCEVKVTPRIGKQRHYRFIKFWRINRVDLGLTELTTVPKEAPCSLSSSSL